MTVTIDLTPEEETRLQKRAARRGQGIESYLHHIIHQEARQEDNTDFPEPGQSLAEALEGLIGVLDSSQKNGGKVSHVAENTGEEFTNILVQKYNAGYL